MIRSTVKYSQLSAGCLMSKFSVHLHFADSMSGSVIAWTRLDRLCPHARWKIYKMCRYQDQGLTIALASKMLSCNPQRASRVWGTWEAQNEWPSSEWSRICEKPQNYETSKVNWHWGKSLRKKNHYFVELAILGKGVTKLFWPFFHQSIVPRVGISKMVVNSISAP